MNLAMRARSPLAGAEEKEAVSGRGVVGGGPGGFVVFALPAAVDAEMERLVGDVSGVEKKGQGVPVGFVEVEAFDAGSSVPVSSQTRLGLVTAS